jgi:hypothetical protein
MRTTILVENINLFSANDVVGSFDLDFTGYAGFLPITSIGNPFTLCAFLVLQIISGKKIPFGIIRCYLGQC